MEFPTLVYRDKGDHQRPGGTYSYAKAEHEEQLKDLIEAGWFLSLPEAIQGYHDEEPEEYGDQQPLTLSEIPQELLIEGVQHWLGHRMRELEIAVPEPEEGVLPEMKMLEEIRIDAAAVALESVKDQSAQHWLNAKAEELGLNPDEGLSSDELLFLICHAFANKKDPVEGEEEQKSPTREELEAKAKELGVKFDGRTGDALLAERIEDALKEA